MRNCARNWPRSVPSATPLTHRLRESEKPFCLDLQDPAASGLTEAGRFEGLATMWATPLWFADKRIGAVLLLWSAHPLEPVDATRLEQTGRFTGLAVGNVLLQRDMNRDAAQRATLEGSARIGTLVMDQMPEGIVTVDKDVMVTALNPAAERIFGFRAQDAIGRHIWEVIDQLRLDGSPFDMQAFREQSSEHWQGRVVHRPLIGSLAGRHIVVDLSLTSIRDESGQSAGYFGMVRPVSPSAQLDSDAALLSSLAVALSRARSRQEVAETSLERLCEGTLAEVGAIVTWTDPRRKSVEASRGISELTVEALRVIEISRRLQRSQALARHRSSRSTKSRSSWSTRRSSRSSPGNRSAAATSWTSERETRSLGR